MACHSTGIQQLLAAEKIAAEKVAEARKRAYLYLFCVIFLITFIHSSRYVYRCLELSR